MMSVTHDTPAGSAPLAAPPDEQTGQPAEESRLAARFAAGERAAAEEVVALYTPQITRLVHRLLAWRGDAEDLVQDVFVRALEARHSFRGESRLETWLVRIAVNVCRAQNRRRWLRSKLFASWRSAVSATSDQQLGAMPLRVWKASEDPLADAITAEQAQHVRAAVARLTPRSREVVVLYYLEQMNAKQVAQALGLRQNTVEVRLNRARKQLAEALTDLQPNA